MKKKRSQAWKSHEKAVAKGLGGRRISRADDWGRSDVDVVVADFPMFRIDGKYRQKFAHHTLLREVKKKYCKDPKSIPLLVTKQARERGAVVSMSLNDFGALLSMMRDRPEKGFRGVDMVNTKGELVGKGKTITVTESKEGYLIAKMTVRQVQLMDMDYLHIDPSTTGRWDVHALASDTGMDADDIAEWLSGDGVPSPEQARSLRRVTGITVPTWDYGSEMIDQFRDAVSPERIDPELPVVVGEPAG